MLNASRPLQASDYPGVIDTWTRSDKVYKSLDTKLFVSSTCHAPEFRRAFAMAFPDIYGQGGEITRRELVDLSGDVEQYNNFFVSMHTAKGKWNDLAREDSIWRVTLMGNEGVEVSPAEILSIKIDANLRNVYPYIGDFDKAYLVRFPLTDPMRRLIIDRDATEFTLRIASALGVATMKWELAPRP